MSEFLAPHYLTIEGRASHFCHLVDGRTALPAQALRLSYPGDDRFRASEKFKVMERRLLRTIINPAGIVVFISGILLIIATGAGAPGTGAWLHAKIVLVLILGAVHGSLAKFRKEFERDERKRTERFYRILNEGPTLLMVVIVFLAVLKPF